MLSPTATLNGSHHSRAKQKLDTEKAYASQEGSPGHKLPTSPGSPHAFRRDEGDLFLTETPCAARKLLHRTPAVFHRRPIVGDQPTKDSMLEAFNEVDKLLQNRPKLPSFAAAEASAASCRGDVEVSPGKSMSKSQSSPAFPLESPNLPRARRDSEREGKTDEGRRQLPHRSLALKLSAKRMLGGENFSSSPVPMAQHKVIGLSGAERHNLVDITALQNRCEMLGHSVSVSQMLERRKQREQQEQDRLRRQQSFQANSVLLGMDDAGASFQDIPWEDRQEQVMFRRRQCREEETYRRLLSTRQVRGLLRADREHPETPGVGSAFIASSCASLARQLVDDDERPEE